MKYAAVALIVFTFLGFSLPIAADDRPDFAWPAAYVISWKQECTGQVFTETYRVDGMNSRTDTKSGTQEFSMAFNRSKRQAISNMSGIVNIIPFDKLGGKELDAPPAPMFPLDGVWKNLGADKVEGKPAIKYQVMPAAPSTVFTVWMGADGKQPLRVQHDATLMTILAYTPGPQDAKFFDAPTQ